ncbi:Ribose-phosphate pyrophosphokinase [Tritrichomonas foetus]|uniref:ribose-phosphate diphosphokinase n=1 Tax=Tritrichomonas foetus TaxID=1144522 RepID=A0A1J4JAP6_9EUKA|nr:Ribose-phosphate pyrophosphokinase [Tritrichomonas foetus]|eukprot:OHS94731.1 Ribose-phosphate pyrophosphokinase [Tritrichomonas foetus]
MSEVVILEHPNASYLSQDIYQDLQDNGVSINHVDVDRSTFPNGEKYYRIHVDSNFSLLGKTGVYIASLTNDDEILDMYRVGTALVQAGLKRRIFVIPFFAYLSLDRVGLTGEIMTAKCNSMLLGLTGSAGEGNVFVFLDLHITSLLHYFEGPCLRMELYGKNALLRGIADQNWDTSNIIIGSTNLRHANWVNSYAKSLGCQVAFCRDKGNYIGDGSMGVVGDVTGKHVVIFDDMIRSGESAISATKVYLAAGAKRVDLVASHLACFDIMHIEGLIESEIQTIIVTNSHPVTQSEAVRSSPKFVVVDVSNIISQSLYEMLPSPEKPHRASL